MGNFFMDIVNESMGNLTGELTDEQVEATNLTPADESEIFLEMLKGTCASDEEYENLVMESAVEMELYGLIDSAKTAYNSIGISAEDMVATEAAGKVVKYKMTKKQSLSREERRACIRLAERGNDPNYEKFRKHKALFFEYRDKIYARWMSKAKAEVRKNRANSARKAMAMSSPAGKDITDRIKKTIEKADKNGKTGAANISANNH